MLVLLILNIFAHLEVFPG